MSSGTSLQTNTASNYANDLLRALGCSERVNALSDHPAIAFKRSGLLKTTRLMFPAPIAAHADGAMMALKTIAGISRGLPKNGSIFLGERARLRKTIRNGRWCAGGYGQLMDSVDGRVALNLVREDDWGLIPAWLEEYVEDWDGIVAKVATMETAFLVERAADIGLAVAKEELPERPKKWFEIQNFETAAPKSNPLIVDLSGLWAGPLASSILKRLGARIVKVEGPDRPDGMRLGHPGFYKLMNAGKECVALDFKKSEDLNVLKALLAKADIVIEASRPRAFRQLGIRAEEFVARNPGKVWARLTAYGQNENRIGFGDDIAISAGASAIMNSAHGEPCFVGDALADPVNGLHLGLAVWAKYHQGGGAVIDMSMRDVLRYAFGDLDTKLKSTARDWTEISNRDAANLYKMRSTKRPVHSLGEDNGILQGFVS